MSPLRTVYVVQYRSTPLVARSRPLMSIEQHRLEAWDALWIREGLDAPGQLIAGSQLNSQPLHTSVAPGSELSVVNGDCSICR